MNLYPAATLQDSEAAALDNLMPGHQNPKMGSRLQVCEQRSTYIQKVVVAADASGGQNFVAEVSGELVDAWAICTTSNASGTATLRRSTTAITSAIVAAVGDVLARTTSLVQASKAIVQGETLNAKANGALDRFILFIEILRT
jgi:Ni2+-binding GTPase involved in maturation of urease and hydrogenase